ncbi:MAG: ribosomal protein S18-alanine N-acetyltransferase [Dehalococcoidales bacterium]
MIYSIRPMVKEDIEQDNEIDHEAFPTQWPPANYRQELQNKIAHYIVACDNTKTVDVSPTPPHRKSIFFKWRLPWQKPRHTPENSPPNPFYIVGFSGVWMMVDEAHVTNIAVRRQYQGKGLGELLLIATIDLSNDLKASFMTLEVRASNLVAQNLYSKYGFVQMGVRRGYYLDNREDAIIMSTATLNTPAFQEHVRQLREALAKKLA